MIGALVELAAVASMLVGGMFLLWSFGAKGWGVAPWGFATGAFLTIAVGFVQAATPLTGSPIVTMSVVAFGPVAWWWREMARGRATPVSWVVSGTASAVVGGSVALHRGLHTFAYHVDSMEYLGVGALLVHNNYAAAVIPDQMDKRFLAVPLLHASAHLAGEYYLASVTPLLACAVVGIVGWLVLTRARPIVGDRGAWWLAALGMVALATMNRFDFHAIYLNGHLFTALGVLAAAGSCWLVASGSSSLGRAPAAVAVLAIIALVLTRAEGTFLALAAVLPVVATSSVGRRVRALLLGTVGLSTALWYGFTAAIKISRDYPLGPSGPMLVAGLAMVAAAVVVANGRWAGTWRRSPFFYEGGIAAIVLLLAYVKPSILTISIDALYNNAYGWFSSWGAAFEIVTMLVIAAVFVSRGQGLGSIRAPVTIFLPLAMFLAYARGSGYRTADADSLNRMLVEVVPLAIVYVLMSAVENRSEAKAPAEAA